MFLYGKRLNWPDHYGTTGVKLYVWMAAQSVTPSFVELSDFEVGSGEDNEDCQEIELFENDELLTSSAPLLRARPQKVFGPTYVSGSATVHQGDVIQNISLTIKRLFLPPSNHNNTVRSGLRKLRVKNDRKKRCIRIEAQDLSSSLARTSTDDSDTTLVEIPQDWLASHIHEDMSCDIAACVCECHRSQRSLKEGLLGGMVRLKAARFDRNHVCERDGRIDYIKYISVWLPEWMAVRRLIEVTTNRSTGTWWLPSLPKLVGDQAIFHYASTGDSVELQRLLIGTIQTKGRRFDPNVVRQENGWTPLHVRTCPVPS